MSDADNTQAQQANRSHKSPRKKQLSRIFAHKKTLPALLFALLAVLIVNVFVMAMFTFQVDAKLSEAIEMQKPQQGTVTVVVPENCASCGALEAERKQLQAQNVAISDTKIISAGSTEGRALLKTYGVERLPAMIFETTAPVKSTLAKAIKKQAAQKGETILMWEDARPPYVSVDDGATIGLVDVTYITDSQCDECYDVRQMQRPILAGFGVGVDNESTVDVNSAEGRALVEAYDITALPTMILSAETQAYPALTNVWSQVGNIAEDGSYVFQNVAALGDVSYKDLETGAVVQGGEDEK